MESDRAQLSSASTALEDLLARITEVAERYAGTERDDVASDLFELERTLRAGSRRLDQVIRRMH